MVFDVAGTLFEFDSAFELAEQLVRTLAEDVHQHIQPPPVGHADDCFLDALGTGPLQDFVQGRDQAFTAFQGEAFLSRVFGVQVVFQALGGGDPRINVFAFGDRETGVETGAFQAGLHPTLLFRGGQIHVFGADGTGVDLAHEGQDVAQGHARFVGQRAGVELRVQIRFGQALETGVQIPYLGNGAVIDGIDGGLLVAADPVGVDEPQYGGLFRRGVDGERARGNLRMAAVDDGAGRRG